MTSFEFFQCTHRIFPNSLSSLRPLAINANLAICNIFVGRTYVHSFISRKTLYHDSVSRWFATKGLPIPVKSNFVPHGIRTEHIFTWTSKPHYTCSPKLKLWVDLRLPISLNFSLYCRDIISSKLSFGLLTRSQ